MRTQTLLQMQNLLIGDNTENPLSQINEELFEIEAVFEIGSAQKFGFEFRMGEEESTKVYYDARREMFITSKNNSSKYIAGSYYGRVTSKDGLISMRIIVDSSMIDVYGMSGLIFHNGFTFASPDSRGMRLFAEGGEAVVKELAVYRLKGMERQSVTKLRRMGYSPLNS